MTDHWYAYIVCCADNTLYTGVTTDIQRRIVEHNHDNKLGARYTRSRRPVHLVYSEEVSSRAEACAREHAIKKLSRVNKEKLITQTT